MRQVAYLVGMGPGDPKLVTIRAAEVVGRSGGVVLSKEMTAAQRSYIAGSAEQVEGTDAASDLGALLDLLSRHPAVSRLYSGDPLIGNDGGHLAGELAARGIRYEVVPGLDGGLAGAASSACVAGAAGDGAVLIAGAFDPHPPPGIGTLVARGSAARRVLEGARGDELERPGLLVRNPGTPRQIRRTGSLQDLASYASELHTGDVLFVGEAAARETLDWFEQRPLFGLRIVVTRPRTQAREFIEALEEEGAAVIAAPLIRIEDPADVAPLAESARDVGTYDWVIFTSVNGVEHFWRQLEARGGDSRALGGVAVCAIGPATSDALAKHGIRVDLMPPQHVAEGVVAAVTAHADLRGRRVLLPRAELARSILPRSLRDLGAEVTEVTAYRTVPDEAGVEFLKGVVASEEVDIVTFTSSSTVRNFAELVSDQMGTAKIASIGPVTSSTAREYGWHVAVEAADYTSGGLRDALVRQFERPTRASG